MLLLCERCLKKSHLEPKCDWDKIPHDVDLCRGDFCRWGAAKVLYDTRYFKYVPHISLWERILRKLGL